MKQALRAVRSAIQWCLQHPLGRSQWITLVICLIVLAVMMIVLGDHIAQTTNRDVRLFDQAAYLHVAKENRGAWWPTWTDGIRNPLYPWLTGMTASGDKATMFAESLKLNVRLGALVHLLIGLWAGRRLPFLFALTLAVLAGPGILLPISTYAGAEVLYYGLFFAAWMQSYNILERFTYARCALLGLTLGFTYLAKPSVTLLTCSLILAGLIRWLCASRQLTAGGWSGLRPVAGLAIALSVSALIMAPRMANSWNQFGTPLQNTSTIYFWEENWEVSYPKLRFLNPRSIHHLAPEERPSPQRYFARNGLNGAWERFSKGVILQCGNFFAPHAKSLWFDRSPSPKKPIHRIFPYRGFLILPPVALVLGLGLVLLWRRGITAFPALIWLQIIFAAMLIAVSLAAYSWYWVIAPGARFILSLYIPILASLLLTANSLRRSAGTPWADGLCAITMVVVLVPVMIHFAQICRNPYFSSLKSVF